MSDLEGAAGHRWSVAPAPLGASDCPPESHRSRQMSGCFTMEEARRDAISERSREHLMQTRRQRRGLPPVRSARMTVTPGWHSRRVGDVDEEAVRTAPCPRCGGVGIPVVFGLPGPELVEAAMRGETIIGGCIVSDAGPSHECVVCEFRWGQWELEVDSG